MTREEAKEFPIDISCELGTMGINYLSCKDGEKMREAIEALEQQNELFKAGLLKDCESCKAQSLNDNSITINFLGKEEAEEFRRYLYSQEQCEDAVSRQAVLDKIKEVCFSKEQEWVDFRISQGSNGQRDLIINFIENLPNIHPKPKTEVLDKIREEIRNFMMEVNPSSSESDYACNYILDVIDKYKAESEPQGISIYQRCD